MLDTEPRLRSRRESTLGFERVKTAFDILPRNGFVIAENAPVLARELGVPVEIVIEILQAPNPVIYPDVPAGLQRIADVGSFSAIWTQGHLDGCGAISSFLQDQDLTFQALKVQRSGLYEYYQPGEEQTKQLGIPWLLGGFDKCDPHIVLPVLEAARQNGLETIIAVDDLEQNLMGMGELCQIAGMPFVPCLMNRKNQTGGIHSFDDLTLVNNSLYLIDLDRTQIDTDGMKEDIYGRLAQFVQQEYHSESLS